MKDLRWDMWLMDILKSAQNPFHEGNLEISDSSQPACSRSSEDLGHVTQSRTHQRTIQAGSAATSQASEWPQPKARIEEANTYHQQVERKLQRQPWWIRKKLSLPQNLGTKDDDITQRLCRHGTIYDFHISVRRWEWASKTCQKYFKIAAQGSWFGFVMEATGGVWVRIAIPTKNLRGLNAARIQKTHPGLHSLFFSEKRQSRW